MTTSQNKLNRYLQPFNAPVTQPRPVVAMVSEIQTEIQARGIKVSRVDIANMVKDVGTTTITSGTSDWGAEFTPGSILNTWFALEAAASAKKSVTNVTAIPLISLYQGTAVNSDYQIYPMQGTAIVNNDAYTIRSGYECGTIDNTQVWWAMATYNNNAGTISNITYKFQWRFISNFDSQYTR